MILWVEVSSDKEAVVISGVVVVVDPSVVPYIWVVVSETGIGWVIEVLGLLPPAKLVEIEVEAACVVPCSVVITSCVIGLR